MYISEFELMLDGSYWQAAVSKEKDLPPTLRLLVIPVGNNYDVIVRDYDSNVLLEKKKLYVAKMPEMVENAAKDFAEYIGNLSKE